MTKIKKTSTISSSDALILALRMAVEESFAGSKPYITISVELRDKIIQALTPLTFANQHPKKPLLTSFDLTFIKNK